MELSFKERENEFCSVISCTASICLLFHSPSQLLELPICLASQLLTLQLNYHNVIENFRLHKHQMMRFSFGLSLINC